MDQQQLYAYRQKRYEGYSPRAARDAVLRTQPSFPWRETKHQSIAAQLLRYGYKIRLEVKPDYDYPLELLGGRFTDVWRPGAVKNRFNWSRYGKLFHPEYEWFVPDEDLASLRRGFSNNGDSRGVADYKAHACVTQMMRDAHGNGDNEPYCVTALVTRLGIELAECGTTLTIRSWWDDEVSEAAQQVLDEALALAEDNLRRLVESVA